MNRDQLLVSPVVAGELIDVGRTKIYQLMGSGELESVAIGRSRRIVVESLHAYVERLRDANTRVGASS